MRKLQDFKQHAKDWLGQLTLAPRHHDGSLEMGSYSSEGLTSRGGGGGGLMGSRRRGRLTPTREQSAILTLLAIQMTLICLFYQFRLTRLLLYPFALLSTVFHEFGHACMCVLTGGRISQIVVKMSEAGLTRFQGGWFCAIVPAGYIGSTLIGALLLFLAFGYRTARGTGIGVLTILVITLFYAGDIFTVVATIVLFVLVLAAILWHGGAWARHFVLFLGAIASVESILAILNGTVFHTIPGSDAYVFSRRCSVIVPAFAYGLLWLVISALLIALSLFSALIVFRRHP